MENSTKFTTQMELAVEINGVVELDVGNKFGEFMKKISGFAELLSWKEKLPDVGWIFVDKGSMPDSIEALKGAMFYLPEDDDDEFFGEDNLKTWLEAPIFRSILEIREKATGKPSLEQYMEAAIHYREYDDYDPQ